MVEALNTSTEYPILHRCALGGSCTTTRFLLKHIYNEAIFSLDFCHLGYALECAVGLPSTEMAALLLTHSNANIIDPFQNSLLVLAVFSGGERELIAALLAAGTDPLHRNSDGVDLFTAAFSMGRSDLLDLIHESVPLIAHLGYICDGEGCLGSQEWIVGPRFTRFHGVAGGSGNDGDDGMDGEVESEDLCYKCFALKDETTKSLFGVLQERACAEF